MKIKATWEFDVDDTWGETKEQCIAIAQAELKMVMQHDDFDSLEWNIVDDAPYTY